VGISWQEIRLRLKQFRESSVDSMASLSYRFQQSASSYARVRVVFAENAAQALNYLGSVLLETREIATSKSATVNELRPGLVAMGYTLVDTYLPQFRRPTQLKNRLEHHWQLPHVTSESFWDSFHCTDRSVLKAKGANGPVKDFVALLGVNAAAAEDGSIFLLQHSTNIAAMLRQARKLILVIGIEKIVADRDAALLQTKCAGVFGMEGILLDLELGDAAGVGADLLGSAAESSDLDREIHLLLLDNGRSRIAQSPFRELLHCISCRGCLKRCPTYRFFGKNLGRYPKDYLWSFLAGSNASVELCLHCQSCRLDCPLNIDIPKLVSKAKATYVARVPSQRGKILTNIPSLVSMGRLAAPLTNLVLHNRWGKLGLEKVIGIDRRRRLPSLHYATLESWFRSRHWPKGNAAKVAYYAGCFASYYDTQVGRAAIQILYRNGCDVVLVRQQCCGMAKIAHGHLDGARQDAASLIGRLTPLAKEGRDILVSCPSCGLALKREYPWLLDNEEAKLVSERTYDLSQYLLAWHQRGKLDANLRAMPLSVAYHNPCHLRAQGIQREPVELMRCIPGLSVIALDRGCCGLAGTFGLKPDRYDLSMEVGAPLFEEIKQIAPQLVATECGACKMQLEQGANRKAIHPLVLIQEAYS